MASSVPFWMYIVGFLALLGPLVTLHELGHYLVGRWLGIEAEAFSVGFGKELAGFTDRRGTRWKLSALPLGGYVQFRGDMNPASMPDADVLAAMPDEARRGSFHHAPLWKRTLTVAAGPLTNLIVTWAVFAGFFIAIGQPQPIDPARTTVIEQVVEGGAAETAGLRPGDRILAIDGDTIASYSDLTDAVMLHPGKRVAVSIERAGTALTVPLTVGAVEETDQFGNASRVGRIGVMSSGYEFRRVPVFEAIPLAVVQSWDIVKMMVTGVAQIVVGDRSVDELGGPIKIAKFSGEQLSLGPLAFVWFAAMISLNLAFINLLPIPGLDGGHLAFYAAEAVRRKPLGARSQEVAYRAGVALVLSLMVFVTINDLVGLPLFGN